MRYAAKLQESCGVGTNGLFCRPALALASALLAFGIGGCAHQAIKKTATPAPDVQASSRKDDSEAVVRNDLMHAVDDLKMVHFDYDSSFLKSEARTILVKNAAWIKNNAKAKIQVAGHCDQRGTVQYNLALGQRRAKAVRDYYIKLGIRGRRVATISYGKEKPICQEMSEDCWFQNRRSESLVAFPQSPDAAKMK